MNIRIGTGHQNGSNLKWDMEVKPSVLVGVDKTVNHLLQVLYWHRFSIERLEDYGIDLREAAGCVSVECKLEDIAFDALGFPSDNTVEVGFESPVCFCRDWLGTELSDRFDEIKLPTPSNVEFVGTQFILWAKAELDCLKKERPNLFKI